MIAQDDVSRRLDPADEATLCRAWVRFRDADAEREVALVALYHLASQAGLLAETTLDAARRHPAAGEGARPAVINLQRC